MAHKVLKPFPLSHDGVRTKDVQKDDVVNVPAHLVEGLTKEGFIEETSEKPAKGKGKAAAEPATEDADA